MLTVGRSPPGAAAVVRVMDQALRVRPSCCRVHRPICRASRARSVRTEHYRHHHEPEQPARQFRASTEPGTRHRRDSTPLSAPQAGSAGGEADVNGEAPSGGGHPSNSTVYGGTGPIRAWRWFSTSDRQAIAPPLIRRPLRPPHRRRATTDVPMRPVPSVWIQVRLTGGRGAASRLDRCLGSRRRFDGDGASQGLPTMRRYPSQFTTAATGSKSQTRTVQTTDTALLASSSGPTPCFSTRSMTKKRPRAA